MKEKELRLAVVCFGGISLAIYMHGVSKEILKLVRGSRQLHALRDRGARQRASFHDSIDPADAEFDTDAVYFDLLNMIGRDIDLRVVVDVIAGASAGGINGVTLARALAHDLPMTPLRDMWLTDADVTELIDEGARFKSWGRFLIRPLFWLAGRFGWWSRVLDAEVRVKLSGFMSSRWFRPPFGGPKMSGLLLKALSAMDAGARGSSSLLPVGHKLELFVTVTDFYGYQRPITIHDPPLIREREHRHVLRFAYQSYPNGDVVSEFDADDVPALCFAARATSSYPGAFPPVQIAEIDGVLAAAGRSWPQRARFLAHHFAPYGEAGADPTRTAFVDGAVLNNKPFKEAIAAIQGRPAYREVDRRLVYIDPDPGRAKDRSRPTPPGFFVTLKGALSDIPRNEPIGDELAALTDYNDRVARQKAIIEAARPSITRLVASVQPTHVDGHLSRADIAHWREAANNEVKANAGFAYEGYVRLKSMAVQTYVGHLIATLAGAAPQSAHARWIALAVQAWCRLECMSFTEATPGGPDLPGWVGFLLSFDVDFRRRRLQFLIQGQNRLYAVADETSGDPRPIDAMKRRFYERLDELRRCDNCEPFSDDTRVETRALFGRAIEPMGQTELEAHARAFAAENRRAIASLIARMGHEFDLDHHTSQLDALMAEMEPDQWPAAIRREILVNYIGFSFWDVLTLSISNWRDLAEFDEIRVDRISPEDAKACRRGASETLRGVRLAHFGAFFSRAHRENDYLWGRLHGADRLIDIVCDAAGIDPNRADMRAFKKRAFATILEAEAPHLTHIPEVLAQVRADTEAL